MYNTRIRAGCVIIQNNAILLVEFHDESGLHYNLPAGGVNDYEEIKSAAKREVKEETSIDVEVGELAFTYEFLDTVNKKHSLGLFFDCKVTGGTASLPTNPDPNQTGVKWISIDELDSIVLYPNIKKEIREFAEHKVTIPLLK
ncbi:NUDIX domain-containing protein [Bacillus salitolerans]|uniref:NUDIX domain-containing protein n=1 Tax=Bacillus salitolerans TaxID=1437434 RepID=A0ABW4LNF3_9BACI